MVINLPYKLDWISVFNSYMHNYTDEYLNDMFISYTFLWKIHVLRILYDLRTWKNFSKHNIWSFSPCFQRVYSQIGWKAHTRVSKSECYLTCQRAPTGFQDACWLQKIGNVNCTIKCRRDLNRSGHWRGSLQYCLLCTFMQGAEYYLPYKISELWLISLTKHKREREREIGVLMVKHHFKAFLRMTFLFLFSIYVWVQEEFTSINGKLEIMLKNTKKQLFLMSKLFGSNQCQYFNTFSTGFLGALCTSNTIK